MVTVEAVIVAIWIASLAVILGGAWGVMHEWAKPATPVPSHRPAHAAPARTPLLEQLLDGWRELAHAHALMTGNTPTPTILIGAPQ